MLRTDTGAAHKLAVVCGCNTIRFCEDTELYTLATACHCMPLHATALHHVSELDGIELKHLMQESDGIELSHPLCL